jgi:hypothetical protein
MYSIFTSNSLVVSGLCILVTISVAQFPVSPFDKAWSQVFIAVVVLTQVFQ